MSHKPLIFVSYSRHDEAWRERITKHLRVLDHVFDVWSDERIALGDTWRDEIRGALETAAAAILLVSADFLTSPFVRSEEVPVLLERRRREGLRVAPVIVKDCAWKAVPWLASMQFHPRDARPLAARTEAEQDEALAELAGQLVKLLGRDPTSFAAAQAAIDAYRCGWQAKLSHLEALHPTRLSGSDDDFTSDQLLDRLSAERLLIVVGSSGAGKSHALRHAARDAVLRGLIPLVVAVRDLDADFGRWLDRSVESLHPRTCGDLLGAAERTGTGTVLLVDVMNPLRPGQLSELVDEVGAFLLRNPMPAVLTTRERGVLSVAIPHSRATLGDITDDDKQAIFALHGGHCLPPSWEPFRTALAVTLLAQCSADLGPDATFHALLAKYATQQLEHAGAGPAAFRFLSKTALDLSERLLWTIPSAEFRRDAERYAETRAATAGLGDAILRSQIILEERGECAFAHEQIQHFFEAEALLDAHSGAALIERLMRPRHADTIPFVIEALTAPAHVSDALRALAQAPLIADCLRGRHGRIARTAAMREARGLLQRLETDLPTQFVAAVASQDLLPGSGAEAYDHAACAGLGSVLLDDPLLLDEVIELLARLDEAWGMATRSTATLTSAPRSQVFHRLCAGQSTPFGGLCFAVERVDLQYGKQLTETGRRALGVLVGRRGPFSLYFAGSLIRGCSTVGARLLPTFLQHAWNTRIHSVRIEALTQAFLLAGVADDGTRPDVVRVLEECLEESKDPFVNTLIFEALAAFDALDTVISGESVQAEIERALAEPEDSHAQALAYSVVCKMFEEVFQGAYVDAVNSLEPGRKATLYAMAAMARREAEVGLFTDFAVRAIVKAPVPIAARALRLHARPPKPSAFFQSDVQTFATAFAALGLRDEEPPRPERELNADESAWQLFGEMQFWLAKLRDSPDQLRARCAPLWQSVLRRHAHAAVHPLWYIEQEASNDCVLRHDATVGICSIVAAFPMESAQLLMYALGNFHKLTSIFDVARVWEQREMARFAIETLGRIGSLDAIPLIEPLAEHPELGRAAVTAIRSIRARVGDADSRP